MGQLFNRLKDFTNSHLNDNKFKEDNFIETEFFINKDNLNEDEELKKIIDNLNINSNNNNNRNDANQWSKSNVNTNYYTVLGVSQSSTKEEVSLAYKTLIKKYHPDKVLNLGKEFQDLAILKTKEINYAYQKIKEERKW